MSRENPDCLNRERAREIAEECYGEVLAYCRRHAPAGYDAADLAQETFLRFVRAEGYTERGRPIAYLMRVAKSVRIILVFSIEVLYVGGCALSRNANNIARRKHQPVRRYKLFYDDLLSCTLAGDDGVEVREGLKLTTRPHERPPS